MDVNLPAFSGSLGIDGHHHTLAAEAPGGLGDQPWILDRRGVDRHLVGTGGQQPTDLLQGVDPASDGKRDEQHLGHGSGELDAGETILDRGGDVQEDQLIRPLLFIAAGRLNRIAGIP